MGRFDYLGKAAVISNAKELQTVADPAVQAFLRLNESFNVPDLA
jgi:hypothetical protein